jgi:hypothetical protein
LKGGLRADHDSSPTRKQRIRMKRYLILAGVAVASFVLGAVCVPYLKRATDSTVPKDWITVVPASYRFTFNSAAMRADIPLPTLTGPEGRVKFLNRDKGIQLGYVLKVPIKPLTVSSLPKQYQKTTQENGYTIGPPDQVMYIGHFEFTLKDADGFILAKIAGPSEDLSAGSDNAVQATTEETVPFSAATKVKTVAVSFSAETCNPCD